MNEAQAIKEFMRDNQIVYLDKGELAGDYVFAEKKSYFITIASPTKAGVRLSYTRVKGQTHNQSPVFQFDKEVIVNAKVRPDTQH